MEPVQGRDVIIQLNVDGSTYLEFGCAEDMSLERVAELVETSTISTGVFKTWDYQSLDYTINLSGLVLNDDPSVKVWDLWAQQENFLVVPYRMIFTDPDGIVKAIVGRLLVKSIAFSGPSEDLASSTIQLQGSGPTIVLDSVGEVELELQVAASVGTASIKDVIITDAIGNETLVYAGPLNQGSTATVSIPSGTYHIRATLNTNQPYGLYSSDAAPGFVVNLNSIPANYVYWPLPATSPIWDFTSNRFLRWEVSDVPIA